MPGHMNVLLAEANVPYDKLVEMDHINPEFPETDVALVLGANDVVNPDARTAGEVEPHLRHAHSGRRPLPSHVLVIKRSMNPGFAGIDNPLFYLDNTMMVFGDAKQTVLGIVEALKEV